MLLGFDKDKNAEKYARLQVYASIVADWMREFPHPGYPKGPEVVMSMASMGDPEATRLVAAAQSYVPSDRLRALAVMMFDAGSEETNHPRR
jgi:hypothetical protein